MHAYVSMFPLRWNKINESHLSCDARKPVFDFPTRSDTNRPVQPQEKARSLKIRIKEEEGLFYPGSENKRADQLRSDLRLCFRIGKIRFCHDAAHLIVDKEGQS